MSARTRGAGEQDGALGRGNLATSLILVFPLFLAYEIGVVFSSSINGVDFVTRTIYAAVGYDRGDYLLVQMALAAGFLVMVAYGYRQDVLGRGLVVSMVLESAIYALTLGSFIILIMQELLGLSLAVGIPLALGEMGEALVISLGAGVHEELVFRLGLMAGGTALLCRTGMQPGWAMSAALMGSALLFSLAHHVGPHGEAFATDVFIYRLLAGTVFGLIFFYRSLAHAVYTHFLYDFYVLAIRP